MAETQKYEPRLKTDYRERVRKALKEKYGYKNEMQIPKLDKIVLNMGIGEAVADSKKAAAAMKDLERIAGQKPVATKARNSIAGFKLREGTPIGVSVTVRGDRMWELFDRLLAVAIPRIRDFRGLNPKSFDGRGNYTFGVNEQLIFPEINFDDVNANRGMDITICTTAETNEQAKALLDSFGFPFRKTAGI